MKFSLTLKKWIISDPKNGMAQRYLLTDMTIDGKAVVDKIEWEITEGHNEEIKVAVKL